MARWSNQSILKKINPEYSLEGLMLKLKFQYFGHLKRELTHWKRPWCWERLKAGGEGDDRGWDGWMASPNQWTWVWGNSRRWWRLGKPGVLQSMGLQKVGHDWATEQQLNKQYTHLSFWNSSLSNVSWDSGCYGRTLLRFLENTFESVLMRWMKLEPII